MAIKPGTVTEKGRLTLNPKKKKNDVSCNRANCYGRYLRMVVSVLSFCHSRDTKKKKLSDSYRDNLVWKSILATDSRDKECMQ